MIFKKDEVQLSLAQFEKSSGAKWITQLSFENPKILGAIEKEGRKLYKKGEMTLEQTWFGKYYGKEIRSSFTPSLEIRWIDETLGWGVFALENLKKMQFVAEYVGNVRKRRRHDIKNAYCFEYVLVQGIGSSYTIDALDQGGVSRYINHSENPNLNSALATIDGVSHVILYAKVPIAKGEQLCYDYGPDYWSKRTAPKPL
ncbi:MAG: hypothetical protein COT85_02410 [Chlamydiae bacterium CG10_big_fil_rev_8_21_14_0_10_42_34]|nr:MAG: hypothetical protein COT85_02410 [Chlamydiae bacterium CG10_big_fil_rev_8_21_14_0_10_42_34]